VRCNATAIVYYNLVRMLMFGGKAIKSMDAIPGKKFSTSEKNQYSMIEVLAEIS
jgi:hypothetical protein